MISALEREQHAPPHLERIVERLEAWCAGRPLRMPTILCARLGLLNEGEATGELDLMLHVLDALPGTIADDLRAGTRPIVQSLAGEMSASSASCRGRTSS